MPNNTDPNMLLSAYCMLLLQIPAVLSSGVTVVVCPLLSLMQDQVKALCCLPSCGGVPATYLSSQQSAAEATAVRRELRKVERGGSPTCKLLYVTPEQLVKSAALREALEGLRVKGLLARVVVDEVRGRVEGRFGGGVGLRVGNGWGWAV